jgi:hypothetical protein
MLNSGQPPMVFFMGGIISGCVAAVVLVIYMNKVLPPKGKRNMKKGLPTSGSPSHITLDDEKTA